MIDLADLAVNTMEFAKMLKEFLKKAARIKGNKK